MSEDYQMGVDAKYVIDDTGYEWNLECDHVRMFSNPLLDYSDLEAVTEPVGTDVATASKMI